MTVPLRQAPLRTIHRREVLASRERLYLTCGHSIERAYHGWSHRARCLECVAEPEHRTDDPGPEPAETHGSHMDRARMELDRELGTEDRA